MRLALGQGLAYTGAMATDQEATMATTITLDPIAELRARVWFAPGWHGHYGGVRWHGHLDTAAPKMRGKYRSVYELQARDRNDYTVRDVQVCQVPGGWELRYLGAVVAPYRTKSEAQRAAVDFLGIDR